MRTPARRVVGDALISAGVVALVLGVLVSTDIRVREQFQTIVTSASPSSVAGAGTRLGEVGSALVEAAFTQSVDHAPMMVLVAAATVLLLFMVRT